MARRVWSHFGARRLCIRSSRRYLWKPIVLATFFTMIPFTGHDARRILFACMSRHHSCSGTFDHPYSGTRHGCKLSFILLSNQGRAALAVTLYNYAVIAPPACVISVSKLRRSRRIAFLLVTAVTNLTMTEVRVKFITFVWWCDVF